MYPDDFLKHLENKRRVTNLQVSQSELTRLKLVPNGTEPHSWKTFAMAYIKQLTFVG